MQIEWIEDTELEIVESFDEENEIVESVNQIIRKGEKDDSAAVKAHIVGNK